MVRPTKKPAVEARQPFGVEDRLVYTPDQITAGLGLRANTLKREMRQARLRYAVRAGRIFILGAWVREWVEGGERVRMAADPPAGAASPA